MREGMEGVEGAEGAEGHSQSLTNNISTTSTTSITSTSAATRSDTVCKPSTCTHLKELREILKVRLSIGGRDGLEIVTRVFVEYL